MSFLTFICHFWRVNIICNTWYDFFHIHICYHMAYYIRVDTLWNDIVISDTYLSFLTRVDVCRTQEKSYQNRIRDLTKEVRLQPPQRLQITSGGAYKLTSHRIWNLPYLQVTNRSTTPSHFLVIVSNYFSHDFSVLRMIITFFHSSKKHGKLSPFLLYLDPKFLVFFNNLYHGIFLRFNIFPPFFDTVQNESKRVSLANISAKSCHKIMENWTRNLFFTKTKTPIVYPKWSQLTITLANKMTIWRSGKVILSPWWQLLRTDGGWVWGRERSTTVFYVKLQSLFFKFDLFLMIRVKYFCSQKMCKKSHVKIAENG